MNYVGLKCPVCGKIFTADDDIVVCPECGAPYHRACYAKVGKCIFSDKHGTPDAWHRPESNNGNSGSETGETLRCPRCGAVNQGNALFCQHCGLPLGAGQQRNQQPYGQSQQPYGQGQQPYGQSQQPFGQGQPFFIDPLGGVNPNDNIDDIPAGEVAKFVQNGTQYYIPVFMNIKKFAKNKFNFSAFIIPGIWMLYRKMYKVGYAITGIMAALYICSAYITYALIMPILQSISADIGDVLDPFSMTSQQFSIFAARLNGLPPGQRFLCEVPALILLIQLIIMIVSGINANKMYLKYSLYSIRRIRKAAPNTAQAETQIAAGGGVNTFAATCAVIVYIIIYYIISSF